MAELSIFRPGCEPEMQRSPRPKLTSPDLRFTVSPGRCSLAGSERPVAFGQHPFLKTVSGVFRHCLSLSQLQKSASDSGPMGDGDHEPAVGSNGGIVPRGRYTC